jgi:hypothetical protein
LNHFSALELGKEVSSGMFFYCTEPYRVLEKDSLCSAPGRNIDHCRRLIKETKITLDQSRLIILASQRLTLRVSAQLHSVR